MPLINTIVLTDATFADHTFNVVDVKQKGNEKTIYLAALPTDGDIHTAEKLVITSTLQSDGSRKVKYFVDIPVLHDVTGSLETGQSNTLEHVTFERIGKVSPYSTSAQRIHVESIAEAAAANATLKSMFTSGEGVWAS